KTQMLLPKLSKTLFIITLPTNNWISRSIVGITTKSSVKLSSRPYFWVGEEVERFSLSEKHTFCK
ncbi:hypothetical protein, partial [Leptospira borgpetersenii]|uniref:hypothetical protein n=1 Tax=Leptospira borgpetersenii TaxID=174 RepID=UPI001D13B227